MIPLYRAADAGAPVVPQSGLPAEQHAIRQMAPVKPTASNLVAFYTETQHGSQAVNSYLRGAPPFDNSVPTKAQALQDLCFANTLKSPVNVFRGIKNDGYIPNRPLAGSTITNYGFTSTSFDQTVPMQFATTSGPVGVGATRDMIASNFKPVIFDVHVPIGFPCILVGAMVQDPAADAEHELIMPDGTKFHIMNDSMMTLHNVTLRWLKAVALPPSHDGPLPIEPPQSAPISRFVGDAATMSVHPAEPGDSAVANAMLRREAFDPGEQRATDGKWTDGGGSVSPPVKLRDGMHLLDQEERAKLKEERNLVIPPAWTHVQIADDPKSDLQALGRDTKGRAQYVYSADHTKNQAAAKFARIKQFHDEVSKLDENLVKDAETSDAAATVLLMRRLGMRPGSEDDTGADKQAHGATNLRARDVVQNDDGSMALDFIGKDGVNIKLDIDDEDVESVIRTRLKERHGNAHLFDADERQATRYFKRSMPNFKLKDMRTYFANDLAAQFIDKMGKPKDKKEYQRMRNQVGDQVSAKLGNTRTMALNAYINPAVFAAWDGEMMQ